MTACAVRADKMAPPSSLVKATANTAREFALSILQIDTQKTHESMRRARFRKPPSERFVSAEMSLKHAKWKVKLITKLQLSCEK